MLRIQLQGIPGWAAHVSQHTGLVESSPRNCIHRYTLMLQADEAEREARLILGLYEDLARNFAGIPVVAGRKSRIESFAGANVTYTIEGMMGDRRALQVGT